MSPKTHVASSGETRQRILDIATELFRDRGYAGTSIRDIAEGLGMTKAALYYHFACKDDVLSALLEPTAVALEEFLDRAEGARDPDPADLMRDLVTILVRIGPTLATAFDDPMTFRSETAHLQMVDKRDRLARVLAGPNPDETRLIRSYAALGTIKSAVQACSRLAPAKIVTDDGVVLTEAHVEDHLDAIVAAGTGALQG